MPPTGPRPGKQETLRESLRGVLEVARMPSFLPVFLMNFMSYSSYVLIVGLWGGPFLSDVYGYGLTARGDLLMLPAISHIIGVVAWGHAERYFGAYKPLVLAGALATAAALGLLAALGKPEPRTLAIWLTVFGVLPAFLPVLIAHGRSFLPPHLVGRGMTLFNIGTMGGTFVVQLASGALIDLFPAQARGLSARRLPAGVRRAGGGDHGRQRGLPDRAPLKKKRKQPHAKRRKRPHAKNCGEGTTAEGVKDFYGPPLAFCAVRCTLLQRDT